jgi:hypothetical protein
LTPINNYILSLIKEPNWYMVNSWIG